MNNQVEKDNERFRYLSAEQKPQISEINDAEFSGKTTNQLINERLKRKAEVEPNGITSVKIKAPDFNPTLPVDRMFDGAPFSHAPQWLIDAIKAGTIRPVCPRHTDYADWEVDTKKGTILCIPDDVIAIDREGNIYKK